MLPRRYSYVRFCFLEHVASLTSFGACKTETPFAEFASCAAGPSTPLGMMGRKRCMTGRNAAYDTQLANRCAEGVVSACGNDALDTQNGTLCQ